MADLAFATLNHSPLVEPHADVLTQIAAAADAEYPMLSPDVFSIRAHLADGGSLAQLADALSDRQTAALGRIHRVVDIVGMATRYDLLDVDDETWDWQFDIVLRHAVHAMQYGGPSRLPAAGRSCSWRRSRGSRARHDTRHMAPPRPA